MKKFDFSVAGWRVLLKVARHKPQSQRGIDVPVMPVAPVEASAVRAADQVATLSLPQPVAEEILAWRTWRVEADHDEVWLRSYYKTTKWEGPVLRADQKPALSSAHGIYALKEKQEAPKGYWVMAFGDEDFREAFGAEGTVALSGIVLEGENGYRAEQAVIRSLKLGPKIPEEWSPMMLADKLAERYGVDVEFRS